jgi:hypothetical protein
LPRANTARARRSKLSPRSVGSYGFELGYADWSSQVNPEILGGLIVEIGGRTIDLSVSYKISKLNKALTDAL